MAICVRQMDVMIACALIEKQDRLLQVCALVIPERVFMIGISIGIHGDWDVVY